MENIVRRNAITSSSPAGVDASAVAEVNINASANTRKTAISNLYCTLPDHSLKNSNCSWFGLFSSKENNNLWHRFKRWKDEDYFISEVSIWYKLITILNVLLLICVMVLAFRLWTNDCELAVVAKKDKVVSEEKINSLKTFKIVVNDWINPAISGLVFLYSTYRVLKRTTVPCVNKQDNYRVAADV